MKWHNGCSFANGIKGINASNAPLRDAMLKEIIFWTNELVWLAFFFLMGTFFVICLNLLVIFIIFFFTCHYIHLHTSTHKGLGKGQISKKGPISGV